MVVMAAMVQGVLVVEEVKRATRVTEGKGEKRENVLKFSVAPETPIIPARIKENVQILKLNPFVKNIFWISVIVLIIPRIPERFIIFPIYLI